MKRVRLLKSIRAEDVYIPAGTICNVERVYSHATPDENFDLEHDGILFWMRARDVEEINEEGKQK